MADQRNGGIAWCTETWNPIRGCTRVSAGCMNCYAESMAVRFAGPGQPYEGTINQETNRWNGTVRLVPEKLSDPLRWQRPRMVFVNSMSDLFHEAVPDEFIDHVFAVMALANQHTFQVLTKRPERMRDYLSKRTEEMQSPRWFDEPMARAVFDVSHEFGDKLPGNAPLVLAGNWPLPNVWIGCTVENQQAADERIPLLLQTPAAVRWVSMEPLLGAVDLKHGDWIPPQGGGSKVNLFRPWETPLPSLDWVVVGGESGTNARPMHPDWARSLRDQCADAGVPFLFKQHGEWAQTECKAGGDLGGDMRKDTVRIVKPDGENDGHFRRGDVLMRKVGKKVAGRLLDGVLHDGYPNGSKA